MASKIRSVGEKMASSAVTFVTIGSLLIIWSGLWLGYMFSHSSGTDFMRFFATGLMLTGITLVLVGSLSGKLGRSAREADMTPVGIDPAANPNGPVVVSSNGEAKGFPVRESAPIVR